MSLHGDQVSFWETGAPDPPGGQGEVLVLVHGIAGGAATWEPVLAELDRRGEPRWVIAPDLFGHGQSTAAQADYSLGGYANEIRDLLAVLGHPRATIVGHSLGGGIALQFLYQYPQSCSRLVLVDAGGLGPELHPILRAVALPGAEWVLPLLAHARVVAAAGWLYELARHLTLPMVTPSLKQAGAAFGSLSDSARRGAFVHTARSVIDMAGQRVSGLDKLYLAAGMPTLIVWGGRDPMIPVEHGRHAAALMPGSRFELFEHAGHFPHCDEPARFTDLLLTFLAGTAPARMDEGEFAARVAEHAAHERSPAPRDDQPE
jgi:pimeloyl-ACP methyl ester carboxylesterase